MVRRLCVLVLLVGFSHLGSAQSSLKNIQFNNITRTDGLPNNTINDIITDNYGFVWIGTNDGLCKYYSTGKIQVYKAEEDTIPGLKSSIITSLHADDENNLWVGTRYGGLSRFHIPTETWKTFLYDSLDVNSISNNEILCITEGKNGQVYIGTEDGLNIYHKETDTFTNYQHDPNDSKSLSAKAVLKILIDNQGWTWVGTWAGGLNLLVEDPSGDVSKNYFRRFDPGEKNNTHNIWSLYQDKDDRYWVGTLMGGLFVMNLPETASNGPAYQEWKPKFFAYSHNEENEYSISSNSILDIHQDKNENIWIASAKGVIHVEPQDIPSKVSYRHSDTIPHIKFYSHIPEYGNNASLIDEYVIDIMEDESGMLWFGNHGGISQFNWYSNQFDLHQLFYDRSSLPNTQNLYVDNEDKVWLAGGPKGLLIYDQQENKYELFDGLKDSHHSVSAIFSPDDISLYIATNAGIAVLNLETKKVHYFAAPEWLKLNFDQFLFTNFFLDRKNRLWISSETGLFLLHETSGEFEYYAHDPLDPYSLSDHSLTHILEDYKGNIWASTYNGLNKLSYDQQDKVSFQRFHQSSEEGGLPNDRIIHMLEIDKKIYLGTTNGLLVLDIETEKFRDISGHGQYSIVSMLSTNDNLIWGSTSEGLFLYNIANDKFQFYTEGDGLNNISFRHNSKFIDKDGNFYFGNKSGFTKLQPESISNNKNIPEVYITDIKAISRKGTTLGSGIVNDQIKLNYDHYSVAFNYVAINYNRAEKNQYAYMLEGFDEHWVYPENNIPAVYTNLDPGTYTFKVKASNNNGYWNETGASTTVIISPAMWQTLWFKFLATFLLGFMIYGGLHRYTKNIQRRNKELKMYNQTLNKEIEERNKIEIALQSTNEELQRSNSELEQFAYIASHDLQEPLRITGSFIDLLANKYSDVLDENAFKYIDFAQGGVNRMGLLIRNLLTFSKVGGTVLEYEKADLKKIVNEKLLDLSRLIAIKKVNINLGVLPEIYCEKSQIAMLFYNLVNNAIKFNESPVPVVSISSQNSFDKDYYSFYVSDNGIGIDDKHGDKIFEIFKRLHTKDAYEGTGIGLALCKKIVERHGGKIWVESRVGKGTTFHFTISKHLGVNKLPEENEQKALVPHT